MLDPNLIIMLISISPGLVEVEHLVIMFLLQEMEISLRKSLLFFAFLLGMLKKFFEILLVVDHVVGILDRVLQLYLELGTVLVFVQPLQLLLLDHKAFGLVLAEDDLVPKDLLLG